MPNRTENLSLFPYLRVADADAAIRFYAEVFGARERFRLAEPHGRVGHAELDFGCGTLMLSEAFPEAGLDAPQPGVLAPVSLHLHVTDCDAVMARALAAGATLERAAQDQFYGERSGVFIDPAGHRWMIGHEVQKLTPDEMQRRYSALFPAQP